MRLEVVLQVKLMCSSVTKPLETDLVKFGPISMLFGLFAQVLGRGRVSSRRIVCNFPHSLSSSFWLFCTKSVSVYILHVCRFSPLRELRTFALQ